MPIFKCDECHHTENTATSRYHIKKPDEPQLCSGCDPKMEKTKRCKSYPSEGLYIDSSGYLRDKLEIESGIPLHLSIVGKVLAEGKIDHTDKGEQHVTKS